MSKRRRPQRPPTFLPIEVRRGSIGAPSVLELDRFSEANIVQWNDLSKDLDELNAVLYVGLEPQRQRHRDELLEALQVEPPSGVEIPDWVRIVPLRYTNDPLSAIGSLRGIGGRFNVGSDVDCSVRAPWPALYLASDQETAYREKFGLPLGGRKGGLSAEELALQHDGSHSVIRLAGHLSAVFDLTRPGVLEPICNVLRKMRLPAEAERLRRRLKIPRTQARLIRTAAELMRATMDPNWRGAPSQFGNPSVSQILGGLILDAGYEAICYQSTKGAGRCVAVFPHCLVDTSFVEIADTAPPDTHHIRLDPNSAWPLCGWETLPPSLRPPAPRKQKSPR
ncbi:MAG: RES family NAD+ phosphorylase [Rhodanobacteraceae bacterium]